jgi:hypothetical protein
MLGRNSLAKGFGMANELETIGVRGLYVRQERHAAVPVPECENVDKT